MKTCVYFHYNSKKLPKECIHNVIFNFYVPGVEFEGILCVSGTETLTLTIDFRTERDKKKTLRIWHSYSINKNLSNDTKVNDLVTLTMTFKLKNSHFGLDSSGEFVLHKHILLCLKKREKFIHVGEMIK